VGRLFVATILFLTYVISLVSPSSIFKLGIWSFTGFAALFPVVLAALFWRRSTEAGAVATVISVAVLWVYFLVRGWNVADYTVAGSGIMPVAAMIVVSATVMVLVSLATRPPAPNVVDRFFRS
jgi:SSS family solute:Na+ symporter